MYDQEADTQNAPQASAGHQGKADAVRHADGKHDIVHLSSGYGVCFSNRIMGKRGGQCRDIQNDFTRFFYSYRRHDWVPVWYQTHAE